MGRQGVLGKALRSEAAFAQAGVLGDVHDVLVFVRVLLVAREAVRGVAVDHLGAQVHHQEGVLGVVGDPTGAR